MKVFVTGASGWIGSSVLPELIAAGHEVSGLARSDEGAARVEAAGATAVRGTLDELDILRDGASAADAVIHLGFKHDFSDMAGAGRTERAAIETFGEALEGTGKKLMFASGVAGLKQGEPVTETDASPFSGPDAMRGGAENLALGYVDRGLAPVSLRFAPTVHGQGDFGFISTIAGVALAKGVSGYIGEGANRWAAVNRADNAHMIALALEKAPAGSRVHGVAEVGIPTRQIAEALGDALGVPVRSIAPEDAEAHFGWIGRFFGIDMLATSDITRQTLGWEPTHATLIEDIAAGYYSQPTPHNA